MLKVGDKFEEHFEVSQRVCEEFIKIFNDKNPLHTDESYAKSKGFKSKVLHGNILGGFLSYFLGERLPKRNIILHSQSIKFIKPVYMNDKLKLKAEVSGVFESVNAIEISFTFENQDGVKVASGIAQIGYL